MYIRNDKSPSIESCGTPHVILPKVVRFLDVTNILFTVTKVALKMIFFKTVINPFLITDLF